MRSVTAAAAPDAITPAPNVALPLGFRVSLDGESRRPAPDRLFGGSPPRGLRLSAAGRVALDELIAGPVRTRTGGLLARRLTDAGLAHPEPPARSDRPDVTVLVPVFDRPAGLDACLTALGRDYPVLVVDDGSKDPEAIIAVAHKHGARVLRRAANGGPGAARESGLAQLNSEYIAFLDSDCVPGPRWIEPLCDHLADPVVAAVAPRIVATPPHTAPGRYAAARGSLDMGAHPARVAPGTRVAYVPTAALLVRTGAIRALGRPAFDHALRVGEDVDLIWRLHDAGWRVRYDPQVRVAHREPEEWSALLRRRFQYGTSAGPLALRHPEAMAPFVLNPWACACVAGVLARRPLLALAALGGLAARSAPSLRRAGLPAQQIVQRIADGVGQSWLGTGRYARQFAAPALAAALLAPRGRRPGRRLAVAALTLAGPASEWLTRRPALDPVRYVAASIADDIAYGSGVWTGSVRASTSVAIRPRLARRAGSAPRTEALTRRRQQPRRREQRGGHQ